MFSSSEEIDRKSTHVKKKSVNAKDKEAEAKSIQILSAAVRALASTGQTPEEIANLLNLTPERVEDILDSVK